MGRQGNELLTVAQVLVHHNLVDLINEHNAILLHCLDGLPLHLQHAQGAEPQRPQTYMAWR